jgi:hypothetical protein
MLEIGVATARLPLGVCEIGDRGHGLAPDRAFSIDVVARLADSPKQEAGADPGADRC